MRFLRTAGIIAQKNRAWRDASTDDYLGAFPILAGPIDDVGYLCTGGTYKAAYAAEQTGRPATNPPFLRQCNDGETPFPPTDPAHLVGVPVGDLGGGACDSVVKGDFNWARRGYVLFGVQGDIVSGKFRVDNTGTAQSGLFPTAGPASMATGSYEATVQRLMVSNFSHNAGFSLTVGGNVYGIYHAADGLGGYQIQILKNAVPQWFGGSIALGGFVGRVTWDGSFVRASVDGPEAYSDSNTGVRSDSIYWDVNHSYSGGGNSSVEFSASELRDAASGGALVHAPIVGAPC